MTSSPAPKVSLAEALSMATGIALEDDAPPPQRTAPGDGWEDVNVTASSPPRSASPPADCWGRITADLRTVNKLAVPFLDDDGGGGEDYVLQPPPKKLGTLQLTGLAFFAVSGSAYGIEEAVSSAGPFLAPLAFVLAPLVWSAPLVLVASELSVALPHSGGYIVWVNTAFGPLLSLLNGMANLLCNVLDCALYPVLLTDYLQRAVLPMLHPSMHEWWREQCAAPRNSPRNSSARNSSTLTAAQFLRAQAHLRRHRPPPRARRHRGARQRLERQPRRRRRRRLNGRRLAAVRGARARRRRRAHV